MNTTYMYIATHLVGAFGYTYFNIPEAIYFNIAIMIYYLYQYTKVGILTLSPEWDVELSYAEHIPLSWKLMHNCVIALSVLMIYHAGYELFAGVCLLYLIITTGAHFTVLMAIITDGGEE